MDFEYSPHRSAGGTMHLLSPTHSQIATDAFPSIKQIRRSLSRSPSKAPRYQLQNATRSSPRYLHAPTSPAVTRSASADAQHAAPKFNVRRTAPIRSLFRRQSANDAAKNTILPRGIQDSVRPLPSLDDMIQDEPDANFDQENLAMTPKRAAAGMRFELDSEPIKFDLLKAHAEKPTNFNDSLKDHTTVAKSSPLKRSDGVMNLDQPSVESPRAKRRSLALGSDVDIFDQGLESGPKVTAASRRRNSTNTAPASTSQPPKSPQRRPFSLRRSTLQQRVNVPSSRPRPTSVEPLEVPTPPPPSLQVLPSMPRTRSRISLESVLPVRPVETASPQPASRPNRILHPPNQPHPLSKALSPSSSGSSLVEEPCNATVAPAPAAARPVTRAHPAFSRSLPIGALRPKLSTGAQEDTDAWETPGAYKSAKPLPAAFMSTGLISKRNRNADIEPGSFGSSLNMPDTPSKKNTTAIEAATPTHRTHLSRFAPPRHEFGSPTTPFSPQALKCSPESFGQNVGIFGSKAGPSRLVRRSSFLSIDGEESGDSPVPKIVAPTTTDELPPTPTKTMYVPPRPVTRTKGNSLRSSLLGRRTTLAPDFFVPPDQRPETQNAVAVPATRPKPETRLNTSVAPFITFTPSGGNTSPSLGRSRGQRLSMRERSPSPLPERLSMSVETAIMEDESTPDPTVRMQTPVEGSFDKSKMCLDSYTPPDASRLSISGEHSLSSMKVLPPATPTGPRDHPFGLSGSLAASSSGYFENDVETNLTARFGTVQVYGSGEFSIVYRVANPLPDGPSARLQSPRSVGRVWAVKKTKKPYAGSKDRSQKMREVKILNALRGSEHIIETVDTWEMKNHLYIQTEFCENGNLKDFLTRTGYKARLDDFRIWKVLLEMSQGLKSIHDAGYIHLDLKPANIFIDWEGVLKIGDFGMASTWPAPPHLDGEGDREYIAPEVLSGQFDKPVDVFSMGMIMLEIAGNIVLPDNGSSWQRLRAGDMSDLPSLTFSTESTLARDESGDPVSQLKSSAGNTVALFEDDDEDSELDLGTESDKTPTAPSVPRPDELVQPPTFMVDPDNEEALDKLVQSLISPDPSLRPDIDSVLASGGLQWVSERRRAGATVYEGNWGPAHDVLGGSEDVEMTNT